MENYLYIFELDVEVHNNLQYVLDSEIIVPITKELQSEIDSLCSDISEIEVLYTELHDIT